MAAHPCLSRHLDDLPMLGYILRQAGDNHGRTSWPSICKRDIARIHDILRRRPFRIFLDAPPDPEALGLSDFIPTMRGQEICAGIAVLDDMCQHEQLQGDPLFLSQVVAAWPGLYAWFEFLFPMNYPLDYSTLTGDAASHTLAPALASASAILSSITTRLALSRAQWEEILDAPHSALGLAVSFYVGCLGLPGLPTRIPRTDPLLLPLYESNNSLRKCLHVVIAQMDKGYLATAVILEVLKGHPRRLLRALGRFTWIIIHSEGAKRLLSVHLKLALSVIDLLRPQYSRVLIKGLLEVLKLSCTNDESVFLSAYTPMAHLCFRNCHALRLAIKYGALSYVDQGFRDWSRDLSEETFFRVLGSSLVYRKTIATISRALEGHSIGNYFLLGTLVEKIQATAEVLHKCKRSWVQDVRCSNMEASQPFKFLHATCN
ncbi:hypothetical protein EV122DRAFT_255693 [Schizophyllum commune]